VTRERTVFRTISALPPWQLSAACIALSEIITSGMSLLLHGTVAWDYLVTGFVASLFVSYSILKLLSLATSELEARVKERTSTLRIWDALIAKSVTAFGMADLDGKVTLANRAWLKLFGYENERDVLGRSIFDFWRDPDKVRAALDELRRDDHWSGELTAVRPDGSSCDVHLTTNIVYADGGRPVCMMGSFLDVTERNRLLEAQRANEARLHEILDSMFGFIGIFDLDGKALYYNRIAAEATGVPLDEVLGLPLWNAYWFSYSLEVQAEVRGFMERAANGEVVHWKQSARIRPEGMITTDATFGPLRDETGAITHILGFGVDITERQRAEEALRQSEERLRQAIRVSDMGIFDHDQHADVIYWSPEQRRIYGWSADEPVTLEKYFEHVHPEDREHVVEAVRRAHDPKIDVAFDIDHRIIRRDGEIRWLTTRAHTFFQGEGEARRPVRTVGAVLDITERKSAEIALTRSRNLLKSVVDTAPIRVFWKDRESRFLGCNQLFAKDGGMASPGDVIGRDDYQLAWREQAELYRADDRKVMESGVPKLGFEEPQTTADGRDIWLRTSKVPLRNEAGEIIGVLGIYEDITERKRSEEALRESEAQLRDAQSMAKIGSWNLGIKGGTLHWSDEVFRIFEIDNSKFEASYEAFLNLVHPDDRDMVNESYTASVANRTPYELIHRLRMADGRIKYVREHCRTEYDENGQPVRSIGTVQDVTEQHLADEQLRKLSQAVEQSSNMILITDARGVIEYVNPKFTQVTGYEADEVIGRTPALFKSHLAKNEKYERFWSALLKGDEWHGEFLNRKKNGDLFWCEESVAPIHDSRGKITHFVAIETDITERRKTADQLQQAQKMETAGRLAGGIAHDFNNLLTIIQGNLDLLHEKLAGQPEVRGLADRALHAADRSAKLVSQLLVFSRQQFLQPQAVDVGALIGRMRDFLKSMLMETISVRISVPDDLWHALVDPAQLENALLNLVLNARDAMPTGGALSIEAENLDLTLDDLPADFGAGPGSFVHIRVADTGAGMPPEVLKRAFEPFFTTKEVGKGSGLGLSMVYGFVKQSGGHIAIESAVNHGTQIDLYLRKTAPERIGMAPADEIGVRPHGGTVLIVEDNAEVREVAAGFLKELGYDLVEASDGLAALGILKSRQHVDLLFTDIVMPGMSGVELARKAQTLRPGIKLLFATGYAEEARPGGAALATDGEVLAKPYRKHDLARAVRNALETQSSR
jgi:PAS domain S-box-containing protein